MEDYISHTHAHCNRSRIQQLKSSKEAKWVGTGVGVRISGYSISMLKDKPLKVAQGPMDMEELIVITFKHTIIGSLHWQVCPEF